MGEAEPCLTTAIWTRTSPSHALHAALIRRLCFQSQPLHCKAQRKLGVTCVLNYSDCSPTVATVLAPPVRLSGTCSVPQAALVVLLGGAAQHKTLVVTVIHW
jgi:hypothetical protein